MAIDRREAIGPAFDALLAVTETVYSVDRSDVDRARALVIGKRKLSARDAIHVAVMEHHGVKRIMSFDAGFDDVPGITRICE